MSHSRWVKFAVLIPAVLIIIYVFNNGNSSSAKLSPPNAVLKDRIQKLSSYSLDDRIEFLLDHFDSDTMDDSFQKMFSRTNKTSVLSSLLIPRTIGSKGHETVRNYLFNLFTRLDWNSYVHECEMSTPFGKKKFYNLVFSKNRRAKKQLVLAAHYDSLIIKGKEFIGAVDSGFPCALLVDTAIALDDWLSELNDDVNLQLIFFDGEEAFVNWSREDSTYGSRCFVQDSLQRKIPFALKDIDVMVLLDLLGSADCKINNYFENTNHLLKLFQKIERQARERIQVSFFHSMDHFAGGIEDDHIPFIENGVPVLHLIPFPFPSVWHTVQDNDEALNDSAMRSWSLLMRMFVINYLIK